MDSSDHTWWLDDSEHKEINNDEPTSCTDVCVDFDLNMNNTLIKKMPSYSIRKMDSSDRNRWLQEAEQAVNHEESLSCSESNTCSESTKSTSLSSKSHTYGIRKMDSSDRNRWLQEAIQEDSVNDTSKSRSSIISNSDSVKSNTTSSRSPTYDIRKIESTSRIQCLQDSEIQEINCQNSTSSDNVSNLDSHTSNSLSATNQTYRVRKMDSFDTPWWLKEENSSRASDDTKLSSNKAESTKSDTSLTKSPEITTSYGVRKMDSFDSPWWLSGDETKQVNSLSSNSTKNQCTEETSDELFLNKNEETSNSNDNQWWLNNGIEPQLENYSLNLNGNSNVDETDSYLDSQNLEPWNNDEYPSIKKMDSFESNWWEQDQKNTDARSTSISIDWSRDGPELSNNNLKNTPTVSPLKNITGVRKMDSFDSPSWLASKESESQSHEPKQSSSGDVVSSSSKKMEELANSSPDWWGENNQSDDFVRTKRTSLRIKNIENVVNEAIEEQPPTYSKKEPNLQDELDQLMLFIGGCRNIDDLLGNEEPPPAAPTTPPDTDSGKIITFFSLY